MTEPVLSFDDIDVPKILEQEEFDGMGDDELPLSDFDGFATDDVEKEED